VTASFRDCELKHALCNPRRWAGMQSHSGSRTELEDSRASSYYQDRKLSFRLTRIFVSEARFGQPGILFQADPTQAVQFSFFSRVVNPSNAPRSFFLDAVETSPFVRAEREYLTMGTVLSLWRRCRSLFGR
jgi:hypothetical protein